MPATRMAVQHRLKAIIMMLVALTTMIKRTMMTKILTTTMITVALTTITKVILERGKRIRRRKIVKVSKKLAPIP